MNSLTISEKIVFYKYNEFRAEFLSNGNCNLQGSLKQIAFCIFEILNHTNIKVNVNNFI